MNMNDCLANDKEWNDWQVCVVWGCIGVISLGSVVYMKRLVQYQEYYPIRELSPILSIGQALGLYGQSVMLLVQINLILLGYDITRIQNKSITLLVLLTLLVCRGLFVMNSIMKSLRIVVAFEMRLNWNGRLEQFFSDEMYMFYVSGIASFVLWGVPFIYLTFLGEQTWYKETMLNEKEISLFGIVENMCEIMILMGIAYMNFRSVQKFEDVRHYIAAPFLVYAMWLDANTVFAPMLNEDCVSLGLLYMWLSCVLRCGVMFVLVIVRPLKQCDQQRSPFAPGVILNHFHRFIRHPICSNTFQHYLPLQMRDVLRQWQRISMALEKQDQQLITSLMKQEKEALPVLYQKLTSQLEYHFDLYRRTVSFTTLQALFQHYDRANQNFYILRLTDAYLGAV